MLGNAKPPAELAATNGKDGLSDSAIACQPATETCQGNRLNSIQTTQLIPGNSHLLIVSFQLSSTIQKPQLLLGES